MKRRKGGEICGRRGKCGKCGMVGEPGVAGPPVQKDGRCSDREGRAQPGSARSVTWWAALGVRSGCSRGALGVLSARGLPPAAPKRKGCQRESRWHRAPACCTRCRAPSPTPPSPGRGRGGGEVTVQQLYFGTPHGDHSDRKRFELTFTPTAPPKLLSIIHLHLRIYHPDY